jgi:hypothetical protein
MLKASSISRQWWWRIRWEDAVGEVVDVHDACWNDEVSISSIS